MAAQKFGEDAAELNYLRRDIGLHWIHLNPFLKALKVYESNRNTYPTLDSFIPEIIAALKEVKQSDIGGWMAETEMVRKPDLSTIPLIGDIYSKKNILFILSSAEPDKDADQKLKRFIERFKNQVAVLRDAKIIADTTALHMIFPATIYLFGEHYRETGSCKRQGFVWLAK